MFVLTPELHETLVNFEDYRNHLRSGLPCENTTQPENPWMGIMDHGIAAVLAVVPMSEDTASEIFADYVEDRMDDNAFYDHVRARYNIGAIDTQSIVEVLKPYSVLRQYY